MMDKASTAVAASPSHSAPFPRELLAAAAAAAAATRHQSTSNAPSTSSSTPSPSPSPTHHHIDPAPTLPVHRKNSSSHHASPRQYPPTLRHQNHQNHHTSASSSPAATSPIALIPITQSSSASSPAPALSAHLIDNLVTLASRLTSVTSLPNPPRPPDVAAFAPSASLHWCCDVLKRLYDHLQLHRPTVPVGDPTANSPLPPRPIPSPSPALLAMRVNKRLYAAHSTPSDDLEGVEDAKVDSEDDDDMLVDTNNARRSSSATTASTNSAKRPRRPPKPNKSNKSTSLQNIHREEGQQNRKDSNGRIPSSRSTSKSHVLSAFPSRSNSHAMPFRGIPPELPLDDDAPLFSAKSSQVGFGSRPRFELPLGSPGNSYLTQMSSWKSLGQGEANRLHRDYSKIFKETEDGSVAVDPGESSIEIAGGDLYTHVPIAERWNLAHKIGEGGYAVVRFATRNPVPEDSPTPDRVVSAVKIISKKSLDLYNERMVSREVFSFRLLGMAGGHSNLVELYEVSEDDDNVYLVMELLEGGELFARIADKGQYTERDAANMVVSMLDSLAFCHQLNLTHRDVKPENFVFSSHDDGTGNTDVKLTDFGIAHYSEDPSALCKTLCGTPLYVAPEVLLRQPYGAEADLWSLGVIVYIMLVGYPPFDDNNLVQLVKKIKYRPVKFDGPEWTLISAEGKQFLSNLLDKDASNRMTAQQALEHDWLRSHCEAATVNVLESAQTNIKSFVSRNRWKAAIQSVKAMNRIHKMVTLSREGQGHVFDELDAISAEKVEVLLVQRADDGSERTVVERRPSQVELAQGEDQRQQGDGNLDDSRSGANRDQFQQDDDDDDRHSLPPLQHPDPSQHHYPPQHSHSSQHIQHVQHTQQVHHQNPHQNPHQNDQHHIHHAYHPQQRQYTRHVESFSSSSSSDMDYTLHQRRAPIRTLPAERRSDVGSHLGVMSALATPPSSSRGSRVFSERGSVDNNKMVSDEHHEGIGATFGSPNMGALASNGGGGGSSATIRSTGSVASGGTPTSSVRRRKGRRIRRISLTRQRRGSNDSNVGNGNVNIGAEINHQQQLIIDHYQHQDVHSQHEQEIVNGAGTMNGGGSAFMLAMDPAFESSDDSHKVERAMRHQQRRRRGASLIRNSRDGNMSIPGRTDTLPIVRAGDEITAAGAVSAGRLSNGNASAGERAGSGASPRPGRMSGPSVYGYYHPSGRGLSLADDDSSGGRIGRALTRGEGGVVRKMSSHARKLVGGKNGRRVIGVVSEERERDRRRPVVIDICEQQKQKRFPWFR